MILVFRQLKGSLMLLLAAAIWGVAFVAQSTAADLVEPFTFNGLRSWIGCVVLVIYLVLRDRKKNVPLIPTDPKARRTLGISGALCGVILFVSVNFQQFGIAAYPDGVAASGRSGFITAIYVVLVPLCGYFFRKKVHLLVWCGVALSLVGMYLLCFTDGIAGLYLGDVLVFACALCFTGHILTVDHFSPMTDGVKLSCMQFFVAGALSFIAMALFETPNLQNILNAWLPLLYAGVLSSGVAYTLQIVGQRDTDPTVASLLMSLESVFAGLGGWLLLNEQLAPRELWGCVLVFGAVILAQVPGFLGKNRAKL